MKNMINKIHKTVFIADGVRLNKNVKIGELSSVWFNAVVRGDGSSVIIGRHSNVQDNCTVHAEKNPVMIGDYVTLGHNSIVHSAEIDSNCLIGMGAVIMDGCKIGKNSLIVLIPC